MARLALIALSAFSIAAVALGGSATEQLSLTADAPIRITESWSYADCGTADDIVHIKSIEVSPDPPKPGEDLSVTVEGVADKVIEEGAYADVAVRLGRIRLLQRRFDVCQEARDANATIQCPVQPDTYKVTQTVTLPKEIPKAKFTVKVQGYSVNEEDLFCLDLTVDFIKRPFFRPGW